VTQAFFALLLGGFAALAGGLSSGRSSRSDDEGPDTQGDPEASGPPRLAGDPDATPSPDATGGPDTAGPPGGGPPGGGPPGGVTGGTFVDGAPASDFPDLPDSAHDLPWGGLTPEEQLIVELINRARMNPAAEVARLSEPLASGIPSAPAQPLAVTRELSAAARAHSRDMDDRNFFSHTNPSGQSASARALEEGHGSPFVGENIGVIGSTNRNFDTQARAEAHHQNLWNSDGHQRNLMFADWTEIGLGYDYGEFNGFAGSTFVTQMFGDRGRTYLTGVVIEDGDGDDFYDIGEGLGGVHITAWDGTRTFATETWASGGYSLELPPGTWDVLFEGGGLAAPVTRQVTIGDRNVKLDIIEDRGTLTLASRLPEAAPEAALVLDAFPVVPMQDLPPVDEEEEAELMMA